MNDPDAYKYQQFDRTLGKMRKVEADPIYEIEPPFLRKKKDQRMEKLDE